MISFQPSRQLLLIEIERRCGHCKARNAVGLTKDETPAYHGFACETCERWTEDFLLERDLPDDWWEDLQIRSFDRHVLPDGRE